MLTELTTTRNNQIDHVLLNVNKFPVFFSTSFTNHTSDHSCIVCRIAKDKNQFKQSFKQQISFDADLFTTPSKRRKLDKDFPKTDLFSKKEIKREDTERKISDIYRENNESRSSNDPTALDLSCLISPNWLNDEVIDKYMILLMNNSTDGQDFMFTTYFHQTFSSHGFKRVENYYRRYNLFNYKNIYIPVHDGPHWFLITYNFKKLEAYDPFNYPDEKTSKGRIERVEENRKHLLQILTNLRENYFKLFFKKHKKQYSEPEIIVHLPPSIPSQDNTWDCGVFLLMFAKFIMFKRHFNFSTSDMLRLRDIVRKELENGKIVSVEEELTINRRKRKSPASDSGPDEKKKLITDSKQGESSNITNIKTKKSSPPFKHCQRRIVNNDQQTCWLNSCLQLILTAMDHLDYIAETGSVLWDHLLLMQRTDPSINLDPTDIKFVLINTEKNRIIREEVPPSNRLFDLGNLPVLYEDSFSVNRIGQQDCRDMFYCIDENREIWPDVFNLFKVNTISSTECLSCGNISRQEVSGEASTFIPLECPSSPVSMKKLIEEKMNGYEDREEWRCEDGCKRVTTGRYRRKINDIEESKFIIFLLERLIRVDGRLTLIPTETVVNDVNNKIIIFDEHERSATFKPIAIIHWGGSISGSGQDTRGHYRGDIFNNKNQEWYRTSDSEPPQVLTAEGLTRKGYIFLYSRC